MAEQKQGAYDELRAEVKKTTPIRIDKLPKPVQDAFYRQMGAAAPTDPEQHYRQMYYQGFRKGQPLPAESTGMTRDTAAFYPTPVGDVWGQVKASVANARSQYSDEGVRLTPEEVRLQDARVLKEAGLTNRVVLHAGGATTSFRNAALVDPDGGIVRDVQQWAESKGGNRNVQEAGGVDARNARLTTTSGAPLLADGVPKGAIRTAKQGISLIQASPKMASRGLTSAMNLGPMMYQMMTQDVDTDFTVKMIPPQFRKPDETGKMREAVVIVNGQPYVQYEGEAYNVPGYEDIGEDLAAYFRENSALSAGKNKLGSDVGESGMEVRESEEQSLRKKVEAGTREAAKSTGPAKGGTPTFEDEYRVGKPKKDPGIPSGYDMLRGN
jgi:hypothetical protein